MNRACRQGERVLLPRLLDVVAAVLRAYRSGEAPYLAGVDIRDAFMNVPAGQDKSFTTAAIPGPGGSYYVVVFDTLVFGSGSSPTLWGRFAAWLGRTTAAVSATDPQVYVDDPVYVMAGNMECSVRKLTHALLWTAVAGFPIKMSKATGGKQLEWIGALICCSDMEKAVRVSIPATKVSQLLAKTDNILSKPVVGSRALRSYTGSLSFVAGLVPHLRPFLTSFWAALSRHVLADDGTALKRYRQLVHVKRIRPALKWVRALMSGAPGPLERTFYAFPENTDLEIVTDASPWGLGGIVWHSSSRRPRARGLLTAHTR